MSLPYVYDDNLVRLRILFPAVIASSIGSIWNYKIWNLELKIFGLGISLFPFHFLQPYRIQNSEQGHPHIGKNGFPHSGQASRA